MRLDRRTQRDDLVGIELAMRGLAEQLLHPPPHEGNARRASDQHHLVDVRRRQSGVGEGHPARQEGGVHEPLDESLELAPRDLAVVRERVERDRQHRPLLGGQTDLGRLGRES